MCLVLGFGKKNDLTNPHNKERKDKYIIYFSGIQI